MDEDMCPAIQVEKLRTEPDVADEGDEASDFELAGPLQHDVLERASADPRQPEAARMLSLELRERFDEQERILLGLESTDRQELDRAVPVAHDRRVCEVASADDRLRHRMPVSPGRSPVPL